MCVLRTCKLTSHSFSFISVNYHFVYQAFLKDFVFSPSEAELTAQTSLCLDWEQGEKERVPFLLSINEPQLSPYWRPKDPSRGLSPQTLKLPWVAWLPVTSPGDNIIVAMSEGE